MIVLDLSILNQKGTPMFNSDTFANRPNFGIVGRIFISTDTSEIYRDTGTSWVLIADTSAGGTITGSGTTGTIPIWSGSTSLGNSSLVEAALQITSSKDLLVNGNAFFIETSTAANNAASLAAYGQNTISYAHAFSSNNIGAIYGAIGGINLQTFDSSATFAQANLASAGVFVNSIDFSTASSTITMTQSSGIRAMTGNQAQLQYQGTNSGTISHAAVQQNLGFFRPSSASGVLTITNAYSHLINALDDYGAGFTFTNRFGIYQAGASDVNYFAASVLIGTNVNSGFKLDVSGTGRFIGTKSQIIANGGNSEGAGISLNTSLTSNPTLRRNWGLFTEDQVEGDFAIKCSTAAGGDPVLGNVVLRILSTGAATFSNKVITGGGTDTGQELQINGSIRINNQISPTSGGNSGQHLIINLDGTQYKIKLENN